MSDPGICVPQQYIDLRIQNFCVRKKEGEVVNIIKSPFLARGSNIYNRSSLLHFNKKS